MNALVTHTKAELVGCADQNCAYCDSLTCHSCQNNYLYDENTAQCLGKILSLILIKSILLQSFQMK